MKQIQKVIDYIDEELADAEKYTKCAMRAKDEGDTAVYDTAYKLANQELQHALDWHEVVVGLIDKARAKMNADGVKVPEYMEYVWNDSHEHYLEQVTEIRYQLDMIK